LLRFLKPKGVTHSLNNSTDLILYQALEAIPLGIAVFDGAGKIVAVNSNLAEVFGVASHEVRGYNLERLLREKGLPPDHPLFQTHAGKEYTGPAAPLTGCHPSYASTHYFKGDDGESQGGVFVLWNARCQQELEQAVFKAERLAIMGQLAAIALHEVRNPLSAIKGFLQLLRRELEDVRQLEYVEVMLEALDRVNNLITNYLRLAKPGTPERLPCDLKELIHELISLYEAELKNKGISFIFSCHSELPSVCLDREQFHQVMVNLLKNAVEVTSAGGEIYIGIEYLKEKDMALLFVRDTGIGISEEALPRIFDPFFTTRERGTGLGLYVCREIVMNHGGEIRITNNPDKGCTVTVTVPCVG
jgi:signal transduction histidine kinase